MIGEKFFHYAEFLLNLGRERLQTIHYSLDGEYRDEVISWKDNIMSTSGYGVDRFHCTTPEFGVVVKPLCKPVIHSTKLDREYYSIPKMEGYGHINGKKYPATAWFDHECSNVPYSETPQWDWVGLKLNCGINIMAYDSNIERISDATIGENTIQSDFILEGKHLSLNDLGMYLIMEPLKEEKVFDPRLGIKYSEQPFNVIAKGGVIGMGMRERTYKSEVT